jgi:NADH:ubiquinone oxidoreductase subunit 6 (subunit J)
MHLAIGLLNGLLAVWGVLTGLLALLIIYRSVVGIHEEDQLILDPAEAHMAAEQKEIVQKIEKVRPYVYVLSVASGALLLAIVGVWLWQLAEAPH